jgi:hypothetical protein
MLDAWHFHVESLLSPGGVAFLPFSAKLILTSLRRLFA